MSTAEALSASYDPFAPEALENPYPYYAALRELAPCCYLQKYDVYFVSRYRDVVAALKNWQTFSSAEGGACGAGTVAAEGASHVPGRQTQAPKE